MNSQTPPSPKTPQRKQISWKHGGSPLFVGSPGPGYCSTPSNVKKGEGSPIRRKAPFDKCSPLKHSKVLGSPISQQNSSQASEPQKCSQSFSKDSESDPSFSKHASSTDPSWGVKTYSSTESNGTLRVELDFPHGGWDEGDDSSDVSSTCSLEIVESEVECNTSPTRRGRKRKQSEVSEEDNAILNGMGEEIERQLEAKAERNRLTVPNVKNILRSVITNPHVQAMVRRSIKSGDVAVSGDSDEISFEPRMTRAKAKLLCDNSDPNLTEVAWATTPHKSQQPSECQALIHEELNDDSEDDEEYHPGEEETSDNEYSEKDGSERGSERDISIEQSPACTIDTDIESLPATPSPSPKPHITDSATQTNWSEDGVFKVPLAPSEPALDFNMEENIALRTRSKLPLNDTPLEEIEQAFIPPDITPDLYDTTCDNADWQEFLKEFMQPMRSEIQNHDDEEEDPEYNVLADEEIIDREELRMDRAVKVSKRELNELMRELLEFTENLSSDDEDKTGNKGKGDNMNNISPGLSNSNSVLANNEDMSLFLDAYMSYGTLAPMTVEKSTPPPSRSPSTPTLHTPVPPISPPSTRTPGTGKKGSHIEYSSNTDLSLTGAGASYFSGGKGKSMFPPSGKKRTPAKSDNFPSSSGGSQSGKKHSVGKPEIYQNGFYGSRGGKKVNGTPSKLDSHHSFVDGQGVTMHHTSGKLHSYSNGLCESHTDSGITCDASGTMDMQGPNIAVPVSESCAGNGDQQFFSPGKEYFLLGSTWDKENGNSDQPQNLVSYHFHHDFQNIEDNNWVSCNEQPEAVSIQANEIDDDGFTSDSELSASLPVSNSPPNCSQSETESFKISGDVQITSDGDLAVDSVILLSATQRLVLEQQMRQYVQLMTQHFLQSYRHPIHGEYADICKEKLTSLHLKAKEKEKSAFKSANLLPALDIVKAWEEKLSSAEGPAILGYSFLPISNSSHLKSRKQKHALQFAPQLMDLMVNSVAFVYPQLLPHTPYRVVNMAKLMTPSEDHLLVIGLEEFTQFIMENNPKCKGRCLRWAMSYVTEYLMVGKDPRKMCNYIRKKKKHSNPIMVSVFSFLLSRSYGNNSYLFLCSVVVLFGA
ncbi:hypothetical protein ONE63_005724 [Megalurothrips usitatus]|uniref:Uncharacterized protein n=1 Tax=Megalurothrips usitatus TaxID=439358 RepID=A0AAV7XYZ5_9NEOP|nr:hypothetical protein ONE63_005724 [Megalurothrips usitatus]